MYLLIDMSERDLIHLALFDESFFVEEKFEGQNRELLGCIDKSLKSIKSTFVPNSGRGKVYKVKENKVEGIMVVVGAGSFTSTRIACVVTNTFAYAQQIPLLAIQKTDVDNIQKLIPKLLKQKPGNYISATYSGEPNIGKKK